MRVASLLSLFCLLVIGAVLSGVGLFKISNDRLVSGLVYGWVGAITLTAVARIGLFADRRTIRPATPSRKETTVR